MLLKILGLVGGFCFAYCGVPAAYATWKIGKSIGTPLSVAWMILVGSIAMYSYLTVKHGFDAILTINYSVEALSWGVIVFYSHFPRSK